MLRSSRSDRPSVVCVWLRGGVDGLSMIVPHGDPLYYRERPRTAVPRAAVIDLDGYFGLHPGLAPLRPYWERGTLALVPAIGTAAAPRSHVDAQALVETEIRGALQGNVERMASIALPGWDTHVNQGAEGGHLARRFAALAQTLAALVEDRHGQMRNVVVVTVSEFGRSVRENRYGGTDHGHATAALVLGGAVRGGRMLGGWPGLAPQDRASGGGVAVRTRIRDLFAGPIHA